MEKLVLFCKTYRNDLYRVVNLIDSVKTHNCDKIPLYISVPACDFDLFASSVDTFYAHLLTDESITDQLVSEKVGGISPGYINQEIVKFIFWKTNVCENYFCLDSDCYFIRDFYYRDFMYNDDTPYSVLVEDKELCIDPDYQSYWVPRFDKLIAIKESLGYQDDRLLTCHNCTTFSCKVLKSFEERFLKSNKYTYKDILERSPYEFSWYNFWLQKEKEIEIVPIEPLFKMFHYKKQYLEAKKKGITERDISRAYIGIVLNSNWNSDLKNLKYIDPTIKPKSFSKRIIRKLANCIAEFD